MTTHQDMVYVHGGIPAIGGGQIPVSTGNYYYVDSGTGSNSNGGTNLEAPLATIDAAIGKCTAGNGDVIVVFPGHAETISGATSLVMDVAGVYVVGLGSGGLRPTLTYSTTASIISVTAANCTLDNVVIVGNVDNIVTGISLAAGADGFTLRSVEMKDGAADKEFLIAIAIAAACTDVTIERFMFHGLGGGMTDCINLAGAADRLKMFDSYIRCDASSYVIDGATAASVGIELRNNVFINIDTAAGLGVAFHNSSTGYLLNNHIHNLKDAVAGFSGTGLAYSQCYGSNALNAQGILVPGADS